MGKANDMGSSWASGLKFKQWVRWIAGDAAVPDPRSRKIMAFTVSLVVVLLALGGFVVGGGGAQTGVKHNPSSAASGSLFPTSPGTNSPASAFSPVTTSTTTVTVPPAKATTVSKRTRQHARHTGARRLHPRNSSRHA
jgi:hypothetical protein